MKQAGIKTFFTEGGDECSEDKIKKLAELQDFISVLFQLVTKVRAFTVVGTKLAKESAKIAIATDPKFWEDSTRIEATGKAFMPSSPFTGLFPVSLLTRSDDEQHEIKKYTFWTTTVGLGEDSSAAQASILTTIYMTSKKSKIFKFLHCRVLIPLPYWNFTIFACKQRVKSTILIYSWERQSGLSRLLYRQHLRFFSRRILVQYTTSYKIFRLHVPVISSAEMPHCESVYT